MTYEYQCTDPECGHRWELEQRISEPPTPRCERCDQLTAKRLISGGQGFQLRGEGWFKTGGY